MLTLQWGGPTAPAEAKVSPDGTAAAKDDQLPQDKERRLAKAGHHHHHHGRHAQHHHARGRAHHRHPHGAGERRRHRSTRKDHPEERSAGGQVGLAAVGAIAAYATLRGGIKVFHYARRSMLRQLLFDLAPALQGHEYWVDFGSLLGIYRDKDLIIHDNDIDLAVLNPKWDELEAHLASSLPQYSVRVHYPSEADGESVFLRVYCALGFADIFGATEIGGGRLLVDCGHGDATAISKDLVLPIASMDFRGVSIKVPGDLEGMMEARYGATWRVPRYMDKGADVVEQNKTYARVFKVLSRFGIRL